MKRLLTYLSAIIIMMMVPIGVWADVVFYVAYSNNLSPTDIKAHIWNADGNSTSWDGVSYEAQDNMGTLSGSLTVTTEVKYGITFEKFTITGISNCDFLFTKSGNTGKTSDLTYDSSTPYYLYSSGSVTAYSEASLRPTVYIGGCIGGIENSWDATTYAMTYDSTEDAWYYDISSTDFANWDRQAKTSYGIGVDFRFKETDVAPSQTISAYPSSSPMTLTSSYQNLTTGSSAGDAYCGVATVSGAASYRVWYKIDGTTRKTKVEVTMATPTVTFSPTSQSYSTANLSVTLTSSNGNDIYYTLDGTTPDTSSSHVSSGNTVTVTGTQTLTAGVVNAGGTALEGIGSQTYTYVDPSSASYYLVGNLNSFGRAYDDVAWNVHSWGDNGAVNKVLKFTNNGDGTYSLLIPASHPAENENEWDKPSKEKQDVSHQFVIAPENAFSGTEYSGDLYTVGDDTVWKTIWGLSLDWSKVLRPTSNNVLNNAATNGSMAASGSTNWEAKMNGGSYTITINPSEGTWSVTNDKYTHVMYVISKQDGYWRASYLTDVTTGDDQAYDHNHGNKSGELSEFPNESGSTVYIAHNWYQNGSNNKFSTKAHLNIFGAWNSNGDLAPVTWIYAKSGATAVSIFPTAGTYSTVMDPTTGRTDGVDGASQSQKVITNQNDPATGNITGKKGNEALISPDATLSPETTTYDNYTVNTPVNLTVTMNSYATGYKFSYGAGSTPSTTGSNTDFGNLSYDGTDVKLGSTVVASGTNTVTIRIQGTKDTSEGAIHDYTYTFNVPVVSNLDFTPKGGFFINKAVITVTNGTAPYTYTIKDASDNVLRTGTSSTAPFTISTPGKLTVTDKDGKSATSTDKFDFTYSTSENYANYYNNGTTAQSVAQEGGKDATNIFLKKADYKNMRIYAWDDTYDQLIQKYQRGETTDIDSDLLSELSALGLTSSTDKWKDIYENDKFIRSEKGTSDDYTLTYNNTRAGFLERDPHVMLTEAYPGTLMSDSRSITIDGEEYYYLTLPLNRLHFTNSEVGIIVTRNDDNPDDLGKNADKYKTADKVISSNSSFIYSSVQNGADYNNSIVDISDAVAGTNVVFYKNTENWTNVKIYLYNTDNDKKTSWDYAPEMKKFDGNIYYYALSDEEKTWAHVIFRDGGSNKTNDLDYGGGRKMYEGKPATGDTGTEQAGNADYITYINKPSKYTVEVQNHPNGDDYLRAMPSDKTVLLDPTWGGVITPKQIGDEETSVENWNGVTGWVAGYRKFVKQDLTQTIYGLDNSKTYTVQAIVRVWSNEGAKVSLKVGDGEAVTSKNYGASSISHVNKNGRVDEKYTQGPDLNDPYFIHYDTDGKQGFGWQKIEATGKPTAAGNLVVTLTFDKGTSTQYDLSDVILLEDANTAGHYWTKLPTDATSVAAIKAGEIDMQDRSTYNAFSFFDRDSGNPNAMIKASNRTVIGLNKGIAYVQDSNNENVLDNVDHRQSRNTISLNEGSTTDWSGRYLYLYDESSDWSDCNAYGATVGFNMMGAKYDRQFTANQHSTMFLPFAVTTEQLKTAGFKELQMVDVNNVTSTNIPLITWDLEQTSLTDYTTTAGQGYIVIAGGNGASLSSFIKPTNGIDVQAANSPSAKKTVATGLVGAYVYGRRYQTEDAGPTTYMNYSYLNDKFRALATEEQGGAEIKPFRATFAVPMSVAGGARMLSTFVIDADEVFTPTGVDKLGVEEQLSGNIYTLDGRLVSTNGKLSELSRGIYVRGGRKIVVK